MERLTLKPRTWFALDYLSAQSADRHASPIWVQEILLTKAGTREILLHFHHANYPEGVQDKTYRLRVLRRTASFIVAERTDAPEPFPLAILGKITGDWIQLHWPHHRPPHGDLQAWCDDAFGRPGQSTTSE